MRRAASIAWLWIAIALAIACGSTDKKPPTGDQGDGKGGAEASASGRAGDHAGTGRRVSFDYEKH